MAFEVSKGAKIRKPQKQFIFMFWPYLYNYSLWVELSMNIHRRKGLNTHANISKGARVLNQGFSY